MQLLLTNDAMTTSLIRGGWERFKNLNNFFYLFSCHLVIKTLIVNSSLLITKKNLSLTCHICVIDLSYQINDYIYTPTN
jgi:hypothetical protein